MDIYYSLFLSTIPLIAVIIDFIYGDPRSSYHPVVLIGNLISYYENHLYPKEGSSHNELFMRGAITVSLVLTTVGVVVGFLVWLSNEAGILMYWAISALVLYICITPRSLARDGLEIYSLLKDGDIELARQRLSWIVGRDTDQLDESNIVRGTVETIAENTTDGIISPLFYFMLFGPLGAALYRAANTMDSMLGYKNERYLYFGRVAAKLDDVLNYIPARLTFLLFLGAAKLLKLDWKNAKEIGLRDARKHPSPNGGYAEAPMAGAMHVRLGGYNYYQGEAEFREYMGDADEVLSAKHIKKSIEVMYLATILFIFVEAVIIFLFW